MHSSMIRSRLICCQTLLLRAVVAVLPAPAPGRATAVGACLASTALMWESPLGALDLRTSASAQPRPLRPEHILLRGYRIVGDRVLVTVRAVLRTTASRRETPSRSMPSL